MQPNDPPYQQYPQYPQHPQYPQYPQHPETLPPVPEATGFAPGQGFTPGFAPGQGYPPGYPPGYGPMPVRNPIDLGRVGAAVTAVCGLIVLFASLLSLYDIAVTPSAAPKANDIDSGTVEVSVGFFSVVPFNAPIAALAIPMLMLLAALTALPAALGRAGQAALVSAVSACASVLLGIVVMLSDPLPSVDLTGTLAKDFADETGTSMGRLVDAVVSVTPGAGLIVSVVFGLLGAAGAVLAYLKTSAPR